MSAERDVNRIVRSWIRTDEHESADRVLKAVLSKLDATPQRRSWWRARRVPKMTNPVRYAIAAAAVLVVALIGYQFLPGSISNPGGPSAAPSPTAAPSTAALIARGTFKLYGAQVELQAAGRGDSVTGTMNVSHGDGEFSVDLKCTKTTEGGVILIAGDITASSSPFARKGAREVLVLKPGSPVYASFDSEGREGGDVRPATSCPALLEQVIETGTQMVVGPDGLEPIEGTVELGP